LAKDYSKTTFVDDFVVTFDNYQRSLLIYTIMKAAQSLNGIDCQ